MMESSSSDEKSRPPVLVRREKRSSSAPRSPAAGRRAAPSADPSRSPSPSNAAEHDDVTSGPPSSPPSSERMQHVYPDVVIVERGRAGKTDVSRVTAGKPSRNTGETTDKTESVTKLCDIGDVTDDEVNASLKDYTFMYKKGDDADSAKASFGDRKLPDQTDHDTCSDISSVSSSIVDYVRRSLTEVGVCTTSGVESRDEQPPPLPVKTTTSQRRAPLRCEIVAAQQIVQDDVIASAWEPTHMSWDEVKYVQLYSEHLH